MLVANWLYKQWGKTNPALTLEGTHQAVMGRLQRDKLPLCLVAFLSERPVGTASLRIREVEIRPQFQSWLGNLYVVPEKRSQGIGVCLIERAVAEARRVGIRELYLYTRGEGSLYASLGWKIIEALTYRGRQATIMKYELALNL
jgi:GNAT superfamily N-acetyltransferase